MIYSSSFLENFFGILFNVLLVLIALVWILRWLFPYLLKFAVRKIQKKFETQLKNDSTYFEKQNTSPITKEKKKVGEYVDFEELD